MATNRLKIKKAADYLKVIAHPTRLEIISLLEAKRELTVSQICTKLEIEQSLVSHHLASMRTKGVLQANRDGINISYSILDPKVLEIIQMAMASKTAKQ
ncbi:MAG: winged helix-turn-helix transcriptional regulator [Bacteroidia bacterium]|jgi:ArsR family transcriptional regulator, virulence genes transcriptional regulator|nr:winged helix-turn-helix transcriptional regulator [Bacteroidia bacterium]